MKNDKCKEIEEDKELDGLRPIDLVAKTAGVSLGNVNKVLLSLYAVGRCFRFPTMEHRDLQVLGATVHGVGKPDRTAEDACNRAYSKLVKEYTTDGLGPFLKSIKRL